LYKQIQLTIGETSPITNNYTTEMIA